MTDQIPLTPSVLMARFPYMFPASAQVSFSRGWLARFSRLCEDIDVLLGPDKHTFNWTQVKEKFGSCRFYWQLGRYQAPMTLDIIGASATLEAKESPRRRSRTSVEVVELMERLSELVGNAEADTRSVCIACGEPGARSAFDGYTLVLCAEHARQRLVGMSLDIWFDPDAS